MSFFSTVSNVEETLKNILIQDINSKHPAFGPTIKVDTSSIVIKRDLEHTYHSESYVKEAMNESMATNYPKTLTPQSGRDKTLQTRVGVVRKTTVKPSKNDPDEPDIDTENIPVVQGSFQITKTEADITENKQNSSPTRHDDKPGQKLTPAKSTTTTKAPTTRTSTTKRVPTSIPKNRPFTIKSTFNIKTKSDSTLNKEIESTTENPIPPSTQTSTTTTSTSTPTPTTTSNVSQILFDLLTNENHFKDLPKIDSLFTVPHVIDNEPWRPITQPYYETSNKPTPVAPIQEVTELNAEDRMGVAEVVDDVSILESMLTPIPPVMNREKPARKPIALIKESYFGSDKYAPNPVYTSFTLPTYGSPIKNMETLGSNFPKPFPIPVDKISSVVEVPFISNDDDDGMPMQRPPKDKNTSAAINVLELDQHEDDTEQVSVDGASIVKKQNTTSTTSTSTSTSTTSSTTSSTATTTTTTTTPKSTSTSKTTSTTSRPKVETNYNSTVDVKGQHTINTTFSHTTRRPNNKVSIIPTTSGPHHTWELVNTSTNEKNDTFSKNSPEKFYNDTLQAIITRNDALFPNTTPKFPSKSSIMRNLTDIIKKYSQKTQEKVNKEENMEVEERHGLSKGTVEVVLDEELEPTTVGSVITLLPAKSNLGVNRPLRPRPKIKPEPEPIEPLEENVRSFFRDDHEAEKLISNLSTENYVQINHEEEAFTESADEINTDVLKNDEEDYSAAATNNMKVYDFSNPASSGNRYPKSNDELSQSTSNAIKSEDVPNVPNGTYRVSYHVTGSVSSKQANKTLSLPAYELALEPDVVLEIPINQSNTLTIDKLRQLASLATVSDSNNNTFFRTPGGGVISTKAIPSSYTLNQAGFKILTKTYNKVQSTKQDNSENSLDKPEKTYSKPNKPQKEKENVTVEEVVKEGTK